VEKKQDVDHRDKRGDDGLDKMWIASSRSLLSGAHSRGPLAPRNDGYALQL